MDDLERWHHDGIHINPVNQADMPPNDCSNHMDSNKENIDDIPPSTAEEIMMLGYPSGDKRSTFERIGYVFAYNIITWWVAECLTSKHCSHFVVSRRDYKGRGETYIEDTDIEALVKNRLKLGDFHNWPKENDVAKLQNGHMAPAGNHRYNQVAFNNTFYLSNIVLMFPNVNKALEAIEREVRGMARRCGKIWCFTGPIYFKRLPELVRKGSKVMIPDGIFKVVVQEIQNKKYRYLVKAYFIENIPNETGEKIKIRIKLNDLERLTRLNFLSNISEEMFKEVKIKKEDKVELQAEWLPDMNIPMCMINQFDEVDDQIADEDHPVCRDAGNTQRGRRHGV